MALNTTVEEYKSIVEEAENVLADINKDLSTVSVNIKASSVEVIKAILMLFGKDYINSDGSSKITYEMYKQVNSMLRDAGKMKLQEYL